MTADPRDPTTDHAADQQADEPQADDPTGQRHELTEDELADEMSEESFPGSDPPSTWAGADDHGHR